MTPEEKLHECGEILRNFSEVFALVTNPIDIHVLWCHLKRAEFDFFTTLKKLQLDS
jgi:tRNA splicing ligase